MVLLDAEDVERFSVQDHEGKIHPKTADNPRPFPFCAECRQMVEAIAAVAIKNRLVIIYVVRCHGEEDLVRFQQENGDIIALPCFSTTDRERKQLMGWLNRGAPEDEHFS